SRLRSRARTLRGWPHRPLAQSSERARAGLRIRSSSTHSIIIARMTVHDLNLPWRDIDTVLLDMDGTLLDLAFDNFFWLEFVPKRYAERTGIGFAEARSDITARYARCVGKLEWYCVEHWSAELGLDIVALKRRYRHRIGYLPGAASFLSAARRAGKPLAIVTNAHPDTIAVKAAETRVHERVDEIVSSHELAAPKESAEFWHAFVRH